MNIDLRKNRTANNVLIYAGANRLKTQRAENTPGAHLASVVHDRITRKNLPLLIG